MPRATLSEIDATARKAMRGFGCPWGMAEEAGRTARWLAAHGLPGAETVAVFLTARAGCCAGTGHPCDLARAASLADRAGTETTVLHGIDHPLLVLGQIGLAADALDRCFRLEWAGGEATVGPRALVREDGNRDDAHVTCIPVSTMKGGDRPSPASRDIAPEAWQTLRTFADRTLVPASETSRAGAGAGVRDDD